MSIPWKAPSVAARLVETRPACGLTGEGSVVSLASRARWTGETDELTPSRCLPSDRQRRRFPTRLEWIRSSFRSRARYVFD